MAPSKKSVQIESTGTYPPQPAPDFPGSTFTTPAPLIEPSDDLPPGFATRYDEDGACRFDFVETKAAELGNPPDMCRLYMWDAAIQVFGDMPEDLEAKIQQDSHPRNHPWGAIVWQTYRLDVKLPNGNYDQSGKRILPNTLNVIHGTSLGKFKAYIDAMTHETYDKTPYSLATNPVPFVA